MTLSLNHDQRGFSLIEMLVATAVSLVALSLAYGTLVGYRRMAFDYSERVDVEHGLRTAIDFMQRDIDRAGFGLISKAQLGQFGVLFPNPVASDAFTSDSLTVWSNAGVAESQLLETMSSVSSPVRVGSIAGFTVGMRVWVIGFCSDDVVRRDAMVITAIDTAAPLLLHHATPTNLSANLSCRYRTGTKVVRLREVTYSLSAPVSGTQNLMRSEDLAPAVVIAAGIDSLGLIYFDGADPANTVQPATALARRGVRRIGVNLAGRALRSSRGSGIRVTSTLAAQLAPRNLILQDGLAKACAH